MPNIATMNDSLERYRAICGVCLHLGECDGPRRYCYAYLALLRPKEPTDA